MLDTVGQVLYPLYDLFVLDRKDERVIPGIIIPVREGKSTGLDRCNCRGIALLLVPGKAFTV